ncbi:MAG: clostripain-related cysteine peptidase [Actinobacteria bacterium]|nr:clostripain-related cysteine peptidase [Actinomycetota bacterium]
MKVKHAIIIVLIILSITLTGCFTNPSGHSIPEWTVMIYLDADNDLESAGINDINEMELVGSSSKVNIVVQADRIPNYNFSNDDWTTTRRYYITQDSDQMQINSLLIGGDLGELNMGDPDTLVDFANWAVTEYPAEKYLLVIWNHGGGFRSPAYSKGIAQDDTSGKDIITMSELEDALSAISVQMGKNIDIVGMDACSMAMIEVAYQIKDYADILVTSEELEPGDGWPYDTILAQLAANPTMSPTQLAIDFVDKYIFSYPFKEVTQSAIDLSYMDDLAGQLSSMADSIMSDTLTSKDAYLNAAYSSQHYSDYYHDFIDLYDFCNKVYYYSNSFEVKAIALIVQQNLLNSVINSDYNGGSVIDTKGLSIYFPLYKEYDSENYDNTNFARDTFWNEMLLSFEL